MTSITVSYPASVAAKYRAKGHWTADSVPAWIERWARQFPDRVAIASQERSWTYAQLWRTAQALAGSLRARGLQRGDVVAVQLPNCIEFLVAYIACGLCKAILQTVHMPYRASEMLQLLEHSGATTAIVVSRSRDHCAAWVLNSLRPQLPALRHIVAVGEPLTEATCFAELCEEDGELVPAPQDPEVPYLILYTSGTSSAPKGVPVIAETYLGNARMIATELGVDQSARLMSAAPFTHLYGLFSVNLAWSVGATIAVLPQYSPPDLVTALDRLRPTGLFCAPAHLAACLQAGTLGASTLASLQFALISGSPCPEALALQVQELMPSGKVLQLWGMTELQAGSFTRPSDPVAVRARTVGRASPGIALRVVGAQNESLPAGEAGELQVQGSSLFAGYHANAAATATAFTADGWFRTGDLAEMDTQGNVRVTGRLKDLINRGGVKFNPADVEAVIDQHPDIVASALVPMADAVLGERVCCFVVPSPRRSISLEEVQSWLRDRGISKIKWPERLEIIDALPLTPTRKIIRGELVNRLAGAS